MVWISSQKDAAFSLSRMISKAVSSPARLPTRPLISMPSMAAQAAEAKPGIVLRTTIFCARSKEVTPYLKMVRSRPAKFNEVLRPDTTYL